MIPQTNLFTSYQLTQEEEIQGQSLNYLQIASIRNQIAALAEQKVALKYDPDKPLEFVQREAELQGSISALTYLVSLSDVANKHLADFNQNQQE